jgi:hypothetical protein
MNKVIALTFSLAVLCAADSLAADRVPAKAWRQVKTYDMQSLQKIDPLPMRQVIGVRFNYRAPSITHLKPNWHYCSIWSRTREGAKERIDNIPVMVSSAALPAFQAISSDPRSSNQYTVYGQVLEDAESRFLFLRLLGTNVKRNARGDALISW